MMKNPLTRDELQVIAPSVFAETKYEKRSDRYTFIPTIRLVEKLAVEGWAPVAATEQRVRTKERRGFQKHMIRFRKYDGTEPLLAVGDSITELVLINSHDGSSAYQLQAGLFRLVCMNGLVIADSTFENIRVKHSGHETREILEASYRVIDDVPRIRREVQELEQVSLTRDEQEAFARSAIGLRFDDSAAPLVESVLRPRRYNDDKNDLWHTFNRVQENLVKGGLRQPALVKKDEHGITSVRRRSSRAVNGIDDNVRLNKALWTLAEHMKDIKRKAA